MKLIECKITKTALSIKSVVLLECNVHHLPLSMLAAALVGTSNLPFGFEIPSTLTLLTFDF